MSTYMRVLQHIHKSQNVSSLEIAKRDIEHMIKAQRCNTQTSSNS